MSAKKKDTQLQEVLLLNNCNFPRHAQLFIMTKTIQMDILFSLGILVVVSVFGASLQKPAGPYEFPLTRFAAALFLACL